MFKLVRRLCELRRVKWLMMMIALGTAVLYISNGYTRFMSAKRDDMSPTMVNIHQTIETVEVVENNVNVKFKATITRNIVRNNPNEVFIRHDQNGGAEEFVFSTRTTMSVEERIRLSSLRTTRGTTTGPRRGNKPSTTLPPLRVAMQPEQNPQQSQQQPQPQHNAQEVEQKQEEPNWNADQDMAQQSLNRRGSRPSGDIVPKVKVLDVDCNKLFHNDDEEYKRAIQFQRKNQKVPIPDEEYSKLAANCDRFKRERQYILQPVSQEEADFPIAFSMVVFKDAEQFERLLRAIYRPQNYYCIHIDIKSDQKFKDAVKSLAQCFDNVFLSSRSYDVQWGWFSVVEPELVCMQDLLKYKKWRYFINLTGQEWPLKTNEDIVKILKVFNGTNSMEGTVKRRNVERTEYIHQGWVPTKQRKDIPPPKGITLTKGSIHITASRAFIEYLFNNPTAKEFTEWLRNTGIPDETLFSSLNHSPDLGVPGAYKGEPETDPVKYPFITRFKNWGNYPFDYPCKGQRVRLVCIWSVGDLPTLYSRPELFTNKFYLDQEQLALDCMEELHYNRTRDEVEGKRKFATLYYQHLGFVKNHV